jgi:hypothetical protein
VAISLDALEKQSPSVPTTPAASADPGDSAPPDAGPEAPSIASPTPPSAPAHAVEVDREPRPARPANGPSRAYVTIGGAIAAGLYGLSPSPSLGVRAFAAVRWSSLELGVEGWADLPASAPASEIQGARARTSLLGAGPIACLHFGDFFGCALGLFASLHASAPGVDGSWSGNAFEILGGVRAGVAIPLGFGLSLRGSADLLADPAMPIMVASGQEVWRLPPVAIASQIGLDARIP